MKKCYKNLQIMCCAILFLFFQQNRCFALLPPDDGQPEESQSTQKNTSIKALKTPELVAILSLSLLKNHKKLQQHTFGSIGMPTWEPVFDSFDPVGTSQIANWKFGKHNALTISYDDSAIGNALHGIPGMAERGLVGTWFVNPGLSAFQNMSATWHQAVNVYHQEIANHTMYHAGGETEAEALASINDASDYIQEHVYQIPLSINKLLGFNKAGGTDWDIPTTGEAWDQRMRDNYLIERKYSTGFYKAMPLEEMKMVVKAKSFSPSWSSIHFHGICDDQNDGQNNPAYGPTYTEVCTCTHIPPQCAPEPSPSDPDYINQWLQWAECRFTSGYNNSPAVSDCKDGGTGAVKKSEIYKFYDYLTDIDEIPAQLTWIAGFIEAQKYMIERDNATLSILEAGNAQIRLTLDLSSISLPAPLNQPGLYDEPITIFTKVPANWSACKVTQNGISHTYIVSNGEARYEIYPNAGEVVLENDVASNIDIPYAGR